MSELAQSLGRGGGEIGSFDKELEPVERWDFIMLQKRVGEIFREHDKQCGYVADTMINKIAVNSITVARLARKTPDDFTNIDKHLTNVFIWTATLADYANINLSDVITEKFGIVCPRCGQNPCLLAHGEECKTGVLPRQTPNISVPISIESWQSHLSLLYPHNYTGNYRRDLKNASTRVTEEVGELASSVDISVSELINSLSHHDSLEDDSKPWEGEFADVLAWALAVAEVLRRQTGNYNIEKSLREKLSDGCNYCKSPKCECPEEISVFESRRRT